VILASILFPSSGDGVHDLFLVLILFPSSTCSRPPSSFRVFTKLSPSSLSRFSALLCPPTSALSHHFQFTQSLLPLSWFFDLVRVFIVVSLRLVILCRCGLIPVFANSPLFVPSFCGIALNVLSSLFQASVYSVLSLTKFRFLPRMSPLCSHLFPIPPNILLFPPPSDQISCRSSFSTFSSNLLDQFFPAFWYCERPVLLPF